MLVAVEATAQQPYPCTQADQPCIVDTAVGDDTWPSRLTWELPLPLEPWDGVKVFRLLPRGGRQWVQVLELPAETTEIELWPWAPRYPWQLRTLCVVTYKDQSHMNVEDLHSAEVCIRVQFVPDGWSPIFLGGLL